MRLSMFITLSCAATAFQSCTVAQAPAPPPSSGASDQWIHVPSDIQQHDDWGSFQDFAAMYDKSYTTDNLRARFNAFVESVDAVAQAAQIPGGPRAELNRFADLDSATYQREVVGGCYRAHMASSYGPCKPFIGQSGGGKAALPESVDWRNAGAVTPVKNQGKCGSCWSFSATGAMEGAWAIATGNLTTLSEQQLMDCSYGYGNAGCNGGIMDKAFLYASSHGMCTESEDPYEAESSKTECSRLWQGAPGQSASGAPPSDDCEPEVFIDGCMDIEPGNQAELQQAVARQPVSVAIEADQSAFQLYAGGIITSPECGTQLDHGVLIVGYGEENGQQYWTVKNSWGPDWGENGYVRIARSNETDAPGICGIAMQPSFPVADPGHVGRYFALH